MQTTDKEKTDKSKHEKKHVTQNITNSIIKFKKNDFNLNCYFFSLGTINGKILYKTKSAKKKYKI